MKCPSSLPSLEGSMDGAKISSAGRRKSDGNYEAKGAVGLPEASR